MKELYVISMSGGLDSATLFYDLLINKDCDIIVVNFNYGQNNFVENFAFRKIITNVLDTNFQNSQERIKAIKYLELTSVVNELESLQSIQNEDIIKKKAKHKFYTPSRNLLFTVILGVIGEFATVVSGYDKLYICLGLHKHTEEAYGKEKTNYWDITPEFVEKMNELYSLNDVVDVSIYAPYKDLYKKDIIDLAVNQFKIPYKLTWSCYDPKIISSSIYKPCNECEACIERKINGEAVGVNDINSYDFLIGE